MMCFRELGIEVGASEREVRSAYARSLKSARPDEDPEAFQRLHLAYRAALAAARADAAADRAPGADSSHVRHDHLGHTHDDASPDQEASFVASPASLVERIATEGPAQAQIDVAPLIPQIISHAVADEPEELEIYLGSHPALWSIPVKAELGHRLMDRLFTERPPIRALCSDVLFSFFGLGTTWNHWQVLNLKRLRAHLQLNWEGAPENIEHLAYRTRTKEGLRLDLRGTLAQRQRMSLARSALRNTFDAAVPGTIDKMADFMSRIQSPLPGHDLPDWCDPAQIRYWRQAAVPGDLRGIRLGVIAIRTAAIFAACAVPAGLIAMIAGSRWLGIGLLTSTCLAAVYIALVFMRAMLAWIVKPHPAHPHIDVLTVPLGALALTLTSFLAPSLTPLTAIGSGSLLAIALLKCAHHDVGLQITRNPLTLFCGLLGVVALSWSTVAIMGTSMIPVALGAALVAWGCTLGRIRSRVRHLWHRQRSHE